MELTDKQFDDLLTVIRALHDTDVAVLNGLKAAEAKIETLERKLNSLTTQYKGV